MSAPATPPGARWTTRRALVLHGVLAVWIPGCAVACWWQVTVAESGDALGWVYSVMWPCFAVFATILWWNLLHDDPDTVGARGVRRLRREAPAPVEERQAVEAALSRAEEQDAELADYNAYLAQLSRTGGAKTWRRR